MKNVENILSELRKSTDVSSQKELLFSLLDTPFKIPSENQSGVEPTGKWEIHDQDQSETIKTIKDSKGNEAIPAFTNDEYFRKWVPKGGSYIAFHGKELFGICVINNFESIVINPNSPLQVEVTRKQIESQVREYLPK